MRNKGKRRLLFITIIIVISLIITIVFYIKGKDNNTKLSKNPREIYNSIDNAKVLDKDGDYKFYWDNKCFVQVFNENKMYDLTVKKFFGEDDLCLLKDDPLVEEACKIKKVVTAFITEITDRSYKTATGYEGYDWISTKLRKELEEKNDPKITYQGIEKGEVVGKLNGSPKITVYYKSDRAADVIVHYEEKFVSATREWLMSHDIKLNKPRRIMAVLHLSQNKKFIWAIDDFNLNLC